MKRLILLLVIVSMLPSGDLSSQDHQGTEYTVSVDGTNLRFSPSTLTINEGDSVRFLWNGEALPHNSVEENGLFDSGEPEREVDYLYTFEAGLAGIYDYFCEPHESVGMDGTITVLEVQQENELVFETSSNVDNKSNFWVYLPIIIIVTAFIFYRTRIGRIGNL